MIDCINICATALCEIALTAATATKKNTKPKMREVPKNPPSKPSKDILVFPNPNPERDYVIQFQVPEFTCFCPLTGQPDFAHFTIDMIADELCVELKSLKMYLWSYRNEGAFHEKVTNKILDDLVAAGGAATPAIQLGPPRADVRLHGHTLRHLNRTGSDYGVTTASGTGVPYARSAAAGAPISVSNAYSTIPARAFLSDRVASRIVRAGTGTRGRSGRSSRRPSAVVHVAPASVLFQSALPGPPPFRAARPPALHRLRSWACRSRTRRRATSRCAWIPPTRRSRASSTRIPPRSPMRSPARGSS